jgi:hypothetical protein
VIVHAGGEAYVLAVTLLEPAAVSPFVVLLPPKAEPQAVQRCSNVGSRGALVRIDA